MSIFLVNPAVVDQGSVNCLDPEPVGSKRKKHVWEEGEGTSLGSVPTDS
jgi:hypothetical protein